MLILFGLMAFYAVGTSTVRADESFAYKSNTREKPFPLTAVAWQAFPIDAGLERWHRLSAGRF